MPYIQESQLDKAIKRLYMLGSPDRRPGTGVGGEDDGGPMGGALAAGMAVIPKKKAQTPSPTLPKSMQHSDEEIAQHFNNLKAAQQQLDIAEAAKQVPINGVWTPDGYKAHMAETEGKQNDFAVSEDLMAHGAELNARGGMGRSQHGISPIRRGY